jgi:hypothetical protein
MFTVSLASLAAGGCDPKAASGAIGVQPEKPMLDKPGPGGVTPTIGPEVDPLHDPTEAPFELPLPPRGIDVPKEDTVPWKLQDPAAKGGCSCRLVCTYLENRKIDCITVCSGTGCE